MCEMSEMPPLEATALSHAVLTAHLNDDPKTAEDIIVELDVEDTMKIVAALCFSVEQLIAQLANLLGHQTAEFQAEVLKHVGTAIAKHD